MIGLGTVINTACILAGGIFGLLFGRRLPQRFRDTLIQAAGVAVLFLGLAGALEKLLTVADGRLAAGGTMMLIGSLALGAILGELLNLEGKLERFGIWLRRKSGSENDQNFIGGFLTASLTVCIGAMAVIGAIEDGTSGNFSILLAKGILDAIIILIMTASQGKGCIFSAIPVAIFQGTITVLAWLAGPFVPAAALDNLSCVGSVLIFCVGINLLWGPKIRVANLLPSIVFAALWVLLPAA